MKRVASLLLVVVMLITSVPFTGIVAQGAAESSVFRVELTWNATPRDLDSHLIGKNSANNDFHLYYQNKRINDIDGSLLATLDVDDTSSYGPENTTVFKSLKNVTYDYYVHNYSKEAPIANCGARVRVYKETGDSSQLLGTYTAPGGNGDYWNVVRIKNGKLTVINRISTQPSATVNGATTSLFSTNKNSFNLYDSEAFLSGNVLHLDSLTGELNAKLSGIRAHYNSITNDFDATLEIEKAEMDSGLKFTKEDYRDYIIPQSVASSDSYKKLFVHNIYMTKDQKDGKPYVSTVFLKENTTKGSPLYKEIQNEALTLQEGKKYDVVISGGNLSGDATYVLSQDSTHKVTSNTGVFSKKDLYSAFKINATIYAYIQNDGKTSEPVKLRIKKTSKDVSWLETLASKNKMGLLGTTGLDIDDSIPVIGGSNISIDLFNFPLSVEIQDETFKITLGFELFERSAEYYGKTKVDKNKTKLNKKVDWEFFKDVVKAADEYKTLDQLKKLKNTRLANQFGKSVSKGTTFSGDILGYVEGQIVNGKLVITDFGGKAAVEFIFNYTQHFSIGPVPAYMYVEAGAEGSFKFNKARALPDTDVPFDLGLVIGITPSLKVGGGAGVRGAASVGIWGKGSLPYEDDLSRKHRKMDLKGEFGAEAELFCFSGSITLLEGQVNIFDTYYGSSNRSTSSNATASINDVSQDSYAVDYSVMARDYARSTSAWKGGANRYGGRYNKAESVSSDSLTELKISVFKNSKTQLIRFGDKLMMVWVDDDSSRDTYNRMKLVYSIYQNGVWSEPKAVYDDGKNDNAPSLLCVGSDVYVAWQKTEKLFTQQDVESFDSVLESTEIYFAKFDTNTNEFSNAYRVTNNNTYDYYPTLVENNGNALLYFVNNTSNNLTATNANSIQYCAFNGAVRQYQTGLNELDSLQCENVGGAPQLAYIMDADGNANTSDDKQLYINNSSVQDQLEQALPITAITYGTLNGENVLFFSDGTNIFYYTGGTKHAVFSSVRPVSGNINVVNRNGKTQLFWTETTTEGSEVFTCFQDGTGFSEPIQLTHEKGLLTDVCVESVGNQAIAVFDRTQRTKQVDEDELEYYQSGQTDLCAQRFADVTDIEVDIPFIEENFLKDSDETTVDIYVKNIGTNQVDEMRFIISDSNGFEQTITHSLQLKSGEGQTVSLPYQLPENIQKSDLTVQAIVPGDCNDSNNTDQYTIGNADLSVNDLFVEYVGDSYNVTGLITNQGLVDAHNCEIQLCLRDRSFVVDNSEVFDLPVGESRYVSFTLNGDDIDFTDEEEEVIAYVNANTQDETNLSANSSVAVAIEAPHRHTFTQEWTVTQQPTCLETGTEQNVCNVCEELVQRDIAAKGHTYDEGVVQVAPTCTTTGEMLYTCVDCAVTKVETINVIPHSYADTVTEPTCIDQGYTTYVCTECGRTYTDNYTNPIWHNFENGTCTRCTKHVKDITLNQYTTATIGIARDDEVFAFTPSESGTYYFFSDAATDTHGYLYDESMKQLTSNDDGGANSNFLISYNFEAGKTYYLSAKYHSSSRTGEYAIGLFDKYVDGHLYSETEKREESCTSSNAGYIKYTCENCANTKTVTLGAVGHHFENGVCSDCGKQLNTIALNQYTSANIDTAKKDDIFVFTPTHSGVYSFFSDAAEDTFGYIYGIDNTIIQADDNSGSSKNFLISYHFEAGQTYCLAAKYISTSQTGSFSVGLFETFTDGHNYTITEQVESGCVSKGHTEYTCQHCGDKKVEYFDVLGHDLVDGVCTRCHQSIGIIPMNHYAVAKIESGGSKAVYAFTPEVSDIYYFFSDSSADTYGTLYNNEMVSLKTNDSGGYSGNFLISYNFEAGKTYYLEARYYSSSATGDFAVGLFDAYTDGHSLVVAEQQAATCNAQGYIKYACEHCSYNKTETLAALGHDFVNGACTRCSLPLITLSLNQSATATISDDFKNALFAFTPELSGTYAFFSDSDSDTYGYVYDSNMNQLASNDDGGNGANFLINYPFEAGKTYYLVARYLRSNTTGEFGVGLFDSYTDGHKYSITNQVDASCTTEGMIEYTCEICHKVLTKHISALGHDFEDGICKRCGINESDYQIESPHPYENNYDNTWIINKPGAKRIAITFSAQTKTESGWDYIYIYDRNDDIVGQYSGNELSSKIINITGNMVKIRLTSDNSNTYFGFSLSNVQAYYEDCNHINKGTITVGEIEATCISIGYTGDICCAECGEVLEHGEDIAVNKNNHYFYSSTVEPICTEKGYTQYTCDYCGYSYKTDYTPATGIHCFNNGLCEYCGKIDTDYDFGNRSIELNNSIEVNISEEGERFYYNFTPTQDIAVAFYSSANCDTYGYLYDSNFKLLAKNDDWGEYDENGNNFRIECFLKANNTYYFACELFDNDDTGVFNIHLIPADTVRLTYSNENLQSQETKIILKNGASEYEIVSSNGQYDFTNLIKGTYNVYYNVTNGLIRAAGELDLYDDNNYYTEEDEIYIPMGDVNGDDVIDIADLSMLLATGNYGNANTEIDLTGDGMITIDDISLVLKATNFGMSSAKIV